MSNYQPCPEFSAYEYRRRADAVLSQLPALGVDAIAVTYQLHVEYLTGTWGSQFWVAPLVIAPGIEPAWIVREFERDRIDNESPVPAFSGYFDRDDAVRVWADALRELGLSACKLGLELDNLDLTYRDVLELQRLLPDLRVVDVSDLLPRVMAKKSREELAVMRASMHYTEAAIQALGRCVSDGVTERQARAAMRTAAIEAGASDLRGGVAFGQHSAVPHSGDADVILRPGDVYVTETAGYARGYCAALCRTGILGTNSPAEAMYMLAREAVEAALDAMRPGALTGDVDRAARAVVERAGRPEIFRHRTGYSNGLRANGRLNLSLKPAGTEILEEGMTFHTPVILFEKGRFSVACSESAVVTAEGGQPLSTLGRALINGL